MERVEKSIDINVPVRTAYNQWTQFEEFPRFMEGVESVTQLDDTRLHWVANVGGDRKEWDARITEQIPDQRIAWRSEGGEFTAGDVFFQSLDANRTRVTVRFDYEPKGITEKIGDMLGVVSRRVENDLERFKDFIEARGHETGAWRGTVR
ncbi:MAG TPA: SRPBCC family protein [Alphaproteobacteria bacterium]|nr:SRPBCC family protein [Alphaproteobacteria bacterium]